MVSKKIGNINVLGLIHDDEIAEVFKWQSSPMCEICSSLSAKPLFILHVCKPSKLWFPFHNVKHQVQSHPYLQNFIPVNLLFFHCQ